MRDRQWYEKFIFFIFLILLGLNIADWLGTAYFISIDPAGIDIEKNPFMKWAFQKNFFLPMVFKMVWLGIVYFSSMNLIKSDDFLHSKFLQKFFKSVNYLLITIFVFVDSLIFYQIFMLKLWGF